MCLVQKLNKIGEANDGILSDGIQGLTYLVQHYEEVIQVVGTLVATYGAYRAALIAANALNKASILIESTQAAIRFAQGISGMTKAQLLFNVAASANPYVLIAAGIAAVVGALVYYKTGTKEASEATEKLNAQLQLNKEINETTTKEFSNSSAKKLSAINKEIAVLKSEYSTLEMRKTAYNSLIALNSSFIGTVDKEFRAVSSLTSVYNSLVRSLSEVALAKGKAKVFEQLGEELAKTQLEKMLAGDSLNKAKKTNKVTTQTYYQNYGGAGVSARSASPTIITTNSNQKQIDESTKMLKDASKKEQEINKKLQLLGEDRVKAITILQAQIRGGIENGRKLSKQEIEAKKEALKIYKGASDEQVATINNSTENLKKANDKNNAEVEKLYGEDTIKGLQQRISKAQEIIETSVIGSEAYNKAFSDKEKFEKRLKEIQVQSFDEQISELKRQFSVRDRLLEQGYSKETVDGMFPELKDKNFLQSMKEQAKVLNDIVNAGKGDSQTKENLANINEQIRILEGRKTVLEEFTKNLEEAKEGKTSSEYIDFLNSQKTTGGSETDLAKNAEVEKRIETEKQLIKDAYQQFISAHLSYEEEKTAISKKYDELRKQAKTQAELDVINQAESKDLSALALQKFQNSDAWVQGFQDMANLSSSELDKVIEVFEKFKLEAGKNLSPTDLKTYMDALKQLRDEATNRNPFKALSEAVKTYISDLKEGKDATASMKAVFKGISASADLTNQAISSGLEIADSLGVQMSDSTKEVIQGVQTTLGGVSDLASGIASANPVQIIKGIAGVVKGMAQIFNGDRKKERRIKEWAKEVEGLKEKYEELKNQVKEALGEDVYADQQKIIANLRQQQALLTKMMNEEKSKKKSDSNKVKDYQNQINAIDQQIEEMYDNITKSILQTDAKELASQLADALIEAYGKGEDAASAYGKVADDVMKNAVKNALKLQLLEKPMQDIIKQMLKNMGFDEQGVGSFDGLTKEERDSLRAMMASASQNYMDALGAYEDLFGESAANAQGLKGDIKGITEKTAGALESQINAIRIYQVEALNISKRNQQIFLDALKYQAEIAYNTRPLFQIQKDIAELNSKVKKPLAGL